MNRVEFLCSLLRSCNTFADVGCDHGYCTQYMFKNHLCKQAYISDISAESLAKAERLLQKEIAQGICHAVCCDGLQGIPQSVEQVLIAGMGGEEIVKILKQGFIPQTFLFQPMKNAEELRRYLLQEGCELTYDGIFFDKKYYFFIKGKRDGVPSHYTEAQLSYGKDSLNSSVFQTYLQEEIEKVNGYLLRDMTENSKEQLYQKKKYMMGVLQGEIK